MVNKPLCHNGILSITVVPSRGIFWTGRWADFRAIVVEAVIKAMTSAYDAVLAQLNLANGENPINELIAKSIVNITATGERAITR